MQKDKQGAETGARTMTLRVGGVAFDLRLVVIVVLSVILPTIELYHNLAGYLAGKLGMDFAHFKQPNVANGYDQVFLFFVVPMLVILILFRENPVRYGFGIGKWREGLVWLAVVCPLLVVTMWFVMRSNSQLREYYGQAFYGGLHSDKAVHRHLLMIYVSLLLLMPWEFLWRGFFLFGVARVTGPGPAILFQAIPFALLHIGKPEIETITTVFSGIGFGFVAWRTQSFLYPLLIHVSLLLPTNLLASGAFG